MTFKDCLAADVGNTFLSGLEFSESHEVNGKTMTAQVDTQELTKRSQLKISVNDGGRGVYARETLAYVKAADFGRLPKIGALLSLDGDRYTVTAAAREGDIYSISLEAMRA